MAAMNFDNLVAVLTVAAAVPLVLTVVPLVLLAWRSHAARSVW